MGGHHIWNLNVERRDIEDKYCETVPGLRRLVAFSTGGTFNDPQCAHAIP